MKIIKKVYEKLLRRDPIRYAKYLGVRIGENCRLTGNPGWGSEPWLIEIKNHVLLSSEVRFITHDAGTFLFRETEKYKDVFKFGPIVIHDNCFIGMRAMLLPGIEIGPNSIVAAGSVVNKSIPPGEVWGGIPAKFIETTDRYAEKCLENKMPYDIEAYKKDMKNEILRVVKDSYDFFDK